MQEFSISFTILSSVDRLSAFTLSISLIIEFLYVGVFKWISFIESVVQSTIERSR